MDQLGRWRAAQRAADAIEAVLTCTRPGSAPRAEALIGAGGRAREATRRYLEPTSMTATRDLAPTDKTLLAERDTEAVYFAAGLWGRRRRFLGWV